MSSTALGWRLAGLLVGLAGASCGDDASRGAPLASPLARRNVLVIDEGIDLSVPELRHKVVAAYTLVCAPEEEPTDAGTPAEPVGDGGVDGGDADAGPPPFEELKRRYLAALTKPRTSCHLREGIDAQDDPLASVARYRERWNGMIRNQRFGDSVFTQQEWDQVHAALDDVLPRAHFHGTGTAGTIARENPDVRLVLVEIQLGDPETLPDTFVCATQSQLDTWVALIEDPEVRDAYLHQPLSSESADLREVIGTYDIGIVSKSYGPISRLHFEQLHAAKGCEAVDARAYFATYHELRVAALSEPEGHGVLEIQAAGNESTALDSGMDSYDCLPEDPRRLLVGSNSVTGSRSSFSNFGACVDVFAPGERVIAPYAGGWLFAWSGTSFATPLVAGLLSGLATDPFDAKETRAHAARNVPVAAFPPQTFYAPEGLENVPSALTLAGSRAPAPQPRRPVDLRSVTEPLRALRVALRRE